MGAAVLSVLRRPCRISADGRFVSYETCWLTGIGSPVADSYVRDRQTDTTEPIAIHDVFFSPSISANGRYVALFGDGVGVYESRP
jgi:hypothetical protein